MGKRKAVAVETFGGRVHVEWDPQGAVTPMGQLPFFVEFLKTAELFDPWVQDSPLQWTSPNAPSKREILGTILLSVLAGHWRYAHITSIRSDGVNPPLLGMGKVVSEDSVRRARRGSWGISDAVTIRYFASLGFWTWTQRSSRCMATRKGRRWDSIPTSRAGRRMCITRISWRIFG